MFEELCTKLFWTTWLSSFTIEFAVMFSKMSHGVVGVLRTELAIAKVCQNELGHSELICSDLHNRTDIEILVQKRVNMFEMYGDIMSQVPTVIYAVLAGSLSDRFGRKPLMIAAILGQILEGVALLVNKVWFSELSLEYLWLTNIYDMLGGGAVWYLAVYGFAADITSVEDRASRMARFDGFEQIAFIVGNSVSPILYNYLGYEGTFGIKIFLASLSMVIVLRAVKAPSPEEEETEEPKESLSSKAWDLLMGMFKTVFKKRSGLMTTCILLQLLAYTMYYISFRECKLWYLYVRKTHGWYQEQFITIKVVRKLLGIVMLMLVLPLLKRFNISDINLLIIFNFLHGVGFFLGSLSMFSSGFLISGILFIPFRYPKYPLARSLLSQSVESSEVGRIFSSLSFISSLVHFFSHPLYALIYDASLETFPGAFMVFTGLIIFVAMFIMIIIKFFFRNRYRKRYPVDSSNRTLFASNETETIQGSGTEEQSGLLTKSESAECKKTFVHMTEEQNKEGLTCKCP